MNNKSANVALLVLRIACGLVLTYYGAQKLFGVFGGHGYNVQIATFQDKLGIPPVLGALSIFAEFFGGIGLFFGALTRLAAFGVFCNMAVASFVSARNISTLSATADTNPMRDIAYPGILMAVALAIMLMGAGSYSLDARFGKRKAKQ